MSTTATQEAEIPYTEAGGVRRLDMRSLRTNTLYDVGRDMFLMVRPTTDKNEYEIDSFICHDGKLEWLTAQDKPLRISFGTYQEGLPPGQAIHNLFKDRPHVKAASEDMQAAYHALTTNHFAAEPMSDAWINAYESVVGKPPEPAPNKPQDTPHGSTPYTPTGGGAAGSSEGNGLAFNNSTVAVCATIFAGLMTWLGIHATKNTKASAAKGEAPSEGNRFMQFAGFSAAALAVMGAAIAMWKPEALGIPSR